jgi:hypothetical protein
MNERDRDAFVRWQGRTLDQFSFASNLLLGLSAGAIGVAAYAVIDGKVATEGAAWWLLLVACGCHLAGIVVGVGVALNRLLDFRKTKEVVKTRRSDLGAAKALRQESRELGRGTWRLLAAQALLFLVGAVVLTVFLVLHSGR